MGGMFRGSGLVGGGVSLIPLVLAFFGVSLGVSPVMLDSVLSATLEVVTLAKLNFVTSAMSDLVNLARSDIVEGLDILSVMFEVWIGGF